jgi:hypothetical protein
MADNGYIYMPTGVGFNHVQCRKPNIGERRKRGKFDRSSLFVDGRRPLASIAAADCVPPLVATREPDTFRRVDYGLVGRSKERLAKPTLAASITSIEAFDELFTTE